MIARLRALVSRSAFDPTGRLGLVVTEAAPGRVVSLAGLGPGVPLFDGAETWA